jgi:hypothetical protein
MKVTVQFMQAVGLDFELHSYALPPVILSTFLLRLPHARSVLEMSHLKGAEVLK